MTQISDAELRQNLSRYLDEAVETGGPIVVTRDGGKANVVILSEADFAGWGETAYLLSIPANTEQLLDSVRRSGSGEAVTND
jgi:prevent-host-death family protein